MRSSKCSLLAALLLNFVVLTTALAQPGDYVPRITAVVEQLQRRIAEVNVEIDKQPNDLQLYSKRGSLYAELYHALYDEGGLGWAYRNKTPELSADALTTKAISDLDRAISKLPSVDLFTIRAEMFEARWRPVSLEIFYSASRMTNWPYDTWEHLLEASTYQFERAILDRVLTNPDFRSALEDYSEALRLSDDAATAREIHKRLARLHIMRAARMPLDVPLVRATVIRPNRYGYSLWRDYDEAIDHLTRGNQSQSECKPFAVKPGQYLCDYYFGKGIVAAEYSQYELALQAFSATEKHLEQNDTGRLCRLYAARRDLYAKMKNFDAALADVAKMNSPLLKDSCRDEGYVVRADAAFEKGDWRAAIANYSEAVKWADTSSARNHLNLIRAYLNLGDAQEALKALNRYCGIGCADEFLALRARAHQMTGQSKLATAEMKTVTEYRTYLKNEETIKANSQVVYGAVKWPAGMTPGKGILLVTVVDPISEAFIRQAQTDHLQRFAVRYWRRRPFRIVATYEEKDTSVTKLYSKTKVLIIGDHNIGPLTLELSPSP